jgi:hypothetical protein
MRIPNGSDRIRRTTVQTGVMRECTKFGRARNVAVTWVGNISVAPIRSETSVDVNEKRKGTTGRYFVCSEPSTSLAT